MHIIYYLATSLHIVQICKFVKFFVTLCLCTLIIFVVYVLCNLCNSNVTLRQIRGTTRVMCK